jgi:hypothetical protein
MAQGDFTILACLKENRPKLSPTCRDVLVSHGQLRTVDRWKIGHVLIRMQESPSPNGTAGIELIVESASARREGRIEPTYLLPTLRWSASSGPVHHAPIGLG